MKHFLFAAVAVLGLATAIPAFAGTASGFYDHIPGQVQAQIKQNYFAAKQAKPVAKDTYGGGLSHVDILSYMLGRPAVTAR